MCRSRSEPLGKAALTSCCSHPTLWPFNFKIWNSETRLVGIFPESSGELEKLPKANLIGSSTHVKGRHMGAKKYIMCWDVFNCSFLDFLTRSWVQRLGISLKLLAVGGDLGDLAPGRHTRHHWANMPWCGEGETYHFTEHTSDPYLLFCFHRSFGSPVG